MKNFKCLLQGLIPEAVLYQYKKRRALHLVKAGNEPEFAILKKILSSNDTVIDIGANMGVFTYFFSKQVKSVHAIEPIPFTYRLLEHNTQKLQMKNTTTHRCAISNKDGVVAMEVPIIDGVKNYYYANVLVGVKNCTSIPSYKLDSVLQCDPEDISFIKCDTEGHEEYCIQGAEEILKRSKATWLMEINGPVYGERGTRLCEMMEHYGYDPFVLDGDQLVTPDKIHYINCFYVHQDLVEDYKKREIVKAN